MTIIDREYLPDGSLLTIAPDHSWDITTPDGKRTRGSATDLNAAKQAMKQVHDAYVIARWAKGALAAGQRFTCTLGDR